ncbi:MAG: DNA-binding transcriptional regulator OxyR [Legionellales bacterium]|nr:DNA-binding transcriptional regulator OxyR [Legionellales bacterium]HAG61901.1 DNA-binding transcriptional regulator OxyR [Coxiellaceae bacterium]|tara:strand:- start:1774 stop:2679 length:906 start_codon:yes stop_codon:yes gene_type:complete
MNLRDLQYLVVLSETLNFRKASEACYVSQPTLSMQIKKLEGELGVILFERDRRFLQITSAGVAMVACAKRILNTVDDMKKAARGFQDPLGGSVSLGVFPSLAPYILPKIIHRLDVALPELSLSIKEKITAKCLQELYDGDLDLVMLASQVDDSMLAQHILFEEIFYVVCSDKHPLSSLESIHPEQIPEDQLLLLDEGHCLREQGLEYCQRIGRRHNTDIAGTSLSTVLAMVSLDRGVTLLPALSLPAVEHLPVSVKPIAVDPPSRKVSLYWRSSYERRELIECLAGVIKAGVQSVSGVVVM